MKKLLLPLLLFTAISSSAMASEVDMSTFSCQEFSSNEKSVTYIIAWVDGYLSAQTDNLLTSDEWLDQLVEHIVQYCSENPRSSVIDVINSIE